MIPTKLPYLVFIKLIKREDKKFTLIAFFRECQNFVVVVLIPWLCFVGSVSSGYVSVALGTVDVICVRYTVTRCNLCSKYDINQLVTETQDL